MDVLADLEARGLIHQSTDRDALAARLAEGPVTLYAGFDPTADSLHVGHLVPLLVLRRFQLAGHHPMALAGGGTGMIGDPGGRSEERNLLDAATVAANVAAIKEQLIHLLGEEGDGWTLLDNERWLGPLTLVEFLREVGKHATVNQMVARESVRTRMAGEHGISYTEFSYMLLQAYDYAVLHDDRGCELQIGGADQWGNIVQGVDLIRRRRGAAVHGITCPLITRSDGRKFGKTEQGTLWLSARRTSPYQFLQFWMNVDDRDVGHYLRVFTFLSLDRIAEIEAAAAADPGRRLGQRALAREMTALVHGAEEAAAAEQAAAILFGAPLEDASPGALGAVEAEVGSTVVPRTRLEEGAPLADLLVETGLVASRSEARRTLAQGAAYVNNRRADDDRTVTGDDLLHGRYVLLRRGKKQYRVLAVG